MFHRPVTVAVCAVAAVCAFGFAASSPADGGATGAGVAPAEGRVIMHLSGIGEEVVVSGDRHLCGDAIAEGPLPVGYPRPTPPGVIEIKSYPGVRRAEVTGEGMRGASSRGFFPLFRHISSNDIAMTAPVEMDYGIDAETGAVEEGADGWRMSFLYRTEVLGRRVWSLRWI